MLFTVLTRKRLNMLLKILPLQCVKRAATFVLNMKHMHDCVFALLVICHLSPRLFLSFLADCHYINPIYLQYWQLTLDSAVSKPLTIFSVIRFVQVMSLFSCPLHCFHVLARLAPASLFSRLAMATNFPPCCQLHCYIFSRFAPATTLPLSNG